MPLLVVFSQKSFVQTSQRPYNTCKMKFVVLALALVGAASAGYIGPVATGYTGLGWGNAAPAVTTYNAYNPVLAASPVTPIVKNIVAAAPAVATYNTYSAPLVRNVVAAGPAYSAYAAPVVKNVFAAPAVSTYAAAPAISTFGAAPAITTYNAAPVVSTFGTPAVVGHGFGGDAWGVDLWKKKKAAAH